MVDSKIEQIIIDRLTEHSPEEPLSPEEIVELYECLVLAEEDSKAKRKRAGAFFTPTPTVDLILEQANPNQGKLPSGTTLLDPACGAGIFLLRAIEHSDLKIGAYALIQILAGIDRDATSITLARILVSIKIAKIFGLTPKELMPLIAERIVCGDSLLETGCDRSVTPESAQGFSFNNSFKRELASGGFSIIVGNPPYGISRGEQLSESELSALKSRFKQYLSGKPNKYMMFMALGYELLKPGGMLSMIVPNSWLGIKSGEALRSTLLNDAAIKSIISFEERVFKEPGVEPVIATIGRNKFSEISLIRIARSGDISGRISRDECLKHPGITIPLSWNDSVTRVFDEINKNSFPLSDTRSPLTPRIALQAYAKGKGTPPQTEKDMIDRIYDRSSCQEKDCYPYLQGSDVMRYQYRHSGSYLKYGPWLAEPQKIERFSGTRILIREIINSAPYILNSCAIEERALYNKSIIHILPNRACAPEIIWGFVAILNSALGSFVIRNHGRKSQRKLFPKIVNDDLRSFPFPLSPLEEWRLLATESKKLTHDIAKLSPQSLLERQALLDQMVFGMYGLNSESIREIQGSLGLGAALTGSRLAGI